MEPDHRSARARSFGAIAGDYDRYRPGPPEEAVEWVLDGAAGLVVEVGAGTGGLTAQLARRATAVIAVEPDHRMHALLSGHATGAVVVTGRAEELPFASGSADAVLGASMWHWVDPARGPAEVARVLRPGGIFGLLWTGADRSVDWVADLFAVAGSGPSDEERRRRRHEVALPAGIPFAEPETHLFSGRLSVSGDELVGLMCTYSRFIVLTPEARAQLRRAIAEAVAGHPALEGSDRVELPLRCVCWRTRRLG